MIKIGMLVGDRYEILEKIGTGGMAVVYQRLLLWEPVCNQGRWCAFLKYWCLR